MSVKELERLEAQAEKAGAFVNDYRVVGFVFAKEVISGVIAERDALAAKLKDAEHDRDEFRRVMNGFAEKLAEMEGQEPVAWIYDWQAPEGLIRDWSTNNAAEIPEGATNIRPLFARQVPAEMSPEFTDTARSALLWVLWHHQGGSSPVGQPIRYALGMDAHERLSEHQVQEAKRWAALTKSESTDFRQARTAPAEPVNVDFGKRGENMFFKIDNQSFLLEYKPEEQDEFDFMKAMLLSAFSRITHGVKTEIQPVNARLLEAMKRAKSALVSFKFVPEHANCWEESDEEDLAAIDGAIAAADAQQERLLQDMHDADREIDRVMAEPAPKAVRLTEDEIVEIRRVLAGLGCDTPWSQTIRDIETAVLRKNGIEVAE